MKSDKNQIRILKLNQQRLLEIKRDGVKITYKQCSGFNPYFEYEWKDMSKVAELIQQKKFKLEICEEDGTQLIEFQSKQLILPYKMRQDDPVIFIGDQRIAYDLEANNTYYLAKKNSTNAVHKSVLLNNSYDTNEHSFSDNLIKYISEKIEQLPNCSKLIFDQQPDMNERQKQAIRKVGQNALTFIKGPPGCGKTKTIGRITRLLLQKQQKIMLGTVSNVGNISILKQLVQQLSIYNSTAKIKDLMNKIYTYNIGIEYEIIYSEDFAPAKLVYFNLGQTSDENKQMDPLMRFYSLHQYLIRNILIVNVDKDMNLRQIEYNLDCIQRKQNISKKFYSIYMQAFTKTISEAHIILTTTVSSVTINKKINDPDFRFIPNAVILDEAAQASWSDTLCFLTYGANRLVLVGDENQLDPTVISQEKVLKQTVFGQLSKKNKKYFVLLDTQYRMHPEISYFPNHYFYQSQLKDGVTHFDRSSPYQHFNNYPISFINHSILESQVYQNPNEISSKGKRNYFNEGQIYIIKHLLEYFPSQQLQNVGIITPYSYQAKVLIDKFSHEVLNYGLTIKTCDGYQGGQKQYIIVSCVRSNQEGKVGFCAQRNRINVTITRAKKGLAIIGNINTLISPFEIQSSKNVWVSLISYLDSVKKIINFTFPFQSFENSQLQVQNNENLNKPKQVSKVKLQKQIEEVLCKIEEQINDSDEQQEYQNLFKKNKKICKKLRKLYLSLSNQRPNLKSETVLNSIYLCYEEESNDWKQICMKMTKKILKQFRVFLKDHSQIELKLQQISTELASPNFANNHLKQSEKIYCMLKLLLISAAIKLIY